MTSDLNHFSEMNLNRANMRVFYNELPGHLQSKFKASIRMDIDGNNVLQGYRGPSHFCNNDSGDSGTLLSSNGLQEVRFWWGLRKGYNLVPVAGTVFFAIGRSVQKALGALEWSSLYFDSKTGECLSHDKNEAAEKLNTIGRRLFDEDKCSEAAEYHKNAYTNCTNGWIARTYKDKENEAVTELMAINLNSQGNELFERGKYVEARDKYKDAYGKSVKSSQYKIYEANREKAQCEIDAIGLSTQAKNLFQQGKYIEAQNKYQQAFDKSQVLKEKNNCSSAKNKIQSILNKLSILDHLWAEAWDVENNIETDQCERAKEMFQWILNEANDNIKTFPEVPKFKQYKTLAGLKIEGNEIFNQGLASQQNGIALFQAGQELKQQEKYKLANEKFKEAKKCFKLALEKFETGSKSDERFMSCVEFVREQINEVIQSLEITKHLMTSKGLHNLDIKISSDNHSDVASCDGTERYDNYSAQI